MMQEDDVIRRKWMVGRTCLKCPYSLNDININCAINWQKYSTVDFHMRHFMTFCAVFRQREKIVFSLTFLILDPSGDVLVIGCFK